MMVAAGTQEDPLDFSALRLARAYRDGELTPSVHIERVLERAHERGGKLGAFSCFADDLSRRQAERAEEMLRAGNDLKAPLLAGIPVPIKDLVEVEGLPFEAGSPALAGNVSTHTDGVAQDIMDAGTLTIGKTTTSEFGMSVFSESPLGAARSPWDTRRTAGGSSGGAGAAVASGIAPLAHGNDAGGSVRVPAACNGVLGMVTSRGTVSSGPHGLDGPGLARHGMLARTVADVALGIDLIARTRPGDAYAGARALDTRGCGALSAVEHTLVALEAREVPPLRIGLITEPMVANVELAASSFEALERARALLDALGHTVVEIPAPMTPEDWQTFMPVWTVGAASLPLPFGPAGSADARVGEKAAGVGALTRWLRGIGAGVSGVEYAAALARIQELTRRMAEAWQDFEAILTPMLSEPPVLANRIPPDPHEDFDFQSRFTPFTSVWNMNGFAAMSVPIHRTVVEGVTLPVGVHLGGTRPGAEGVLLSIAAQLEALDPWPTLITP
ncbi:amidase [Dermabacter vaginalis]|nr:amidase [Dermabacter vaginalis]